MIEKLYRNSECINSVQAVTPKICNRCLGSNIYKDLNGQYYCLDCFDYGEVNDQMTIYRYNRIVTPYKHRLEMDFKLSAKQKSGSDFLMGCFKDKMSGFLQAVCGAGKTEMTLNVILEAINSGQKVAFVIPRVTVLKELQKRLEQYFPYTKIKALYEGNKNYDDANVILSTPQQMIYFYQEFHLIIVDEVDAFPFADNPFLKRLVLKARHQHGVILYMSATVNEEYRWQIQNKSLRHHLIPSRFHMRTLPIPVFIRLSSRKQLIQEVISRCLQTRQTLVFVPTIEFGIELNNELTKMNQQVHFVSSKTKESRELIQSFRRKEYRVLITTTILERGVTFSEIDCIVFHADHRVFKKQTLIQIAGRVGREATPSGGEVMFYSTYLSESMKQARKEIIWMNRQHEMQTL